MVAKPSSWPLLLKVGGLTLLGLLWVFGPILPPFILGIFLAYLYDPLNTQLKKLGLDSMWAGAALTLLTYILVVFLVVLLWPFMRFLSHLFSESFYELGTMVWEKAMAWLHGHPSFDALFKEHVNQGLLKEAHSLFLQFLNGIGHLGLSIWHNGWAVAQILCTILLAPIIGFYFIKDRQRITRGVLTMIPPRHRLSVVGGLLEIHQSFASYMRGQTLVCSLLALYYGLGLGLSGLKFGFTLGLITGLFAFVPYVTFLASLMISLLLSLSGITNLGIILGLYGVGYVLDGLVLTPWIVGRNTGLHPVWLLFSVFAGAALKGFTGVFLALPMATLLAACARLVYRSYLKSSFYQKKIVDRLKS